jgi:hypothetical protein
MSRGKSEPRIRRAEHNASNRYFMVVRATAQNAALSYEALGLLTYLLSHSDNWIVQPDELRGRGAGRDRVYKLLKELIDHGFIERRIERDDKMRVTGVDYFVNEELNPEKPDTVNQDTVSPDTEKPHINKYKKAISTKEKNVANATPVEKPRKPIFDAIAAGSFNIHDTANVNGNGGRIGKLEAWVKKNYPGATEKTITAFYKWWKNENPKASAPRDLDKFSDNFIAFHQAMTAKQAAESVPAPEPEPVITEADRAESLAILRAARGKVSA